VTDAANERKQLDESLLGVLVVGGFATKAERDAFAPKLAANETREATMKELLALKPKINVVSVVGKLGHASADIAAANMKQVEKTDAIVEAVNEYQAVQGKKTGKKISYTDAFNYIQRTKPELFTDTAGDTTITR